MKTLKRIACILILALSIVACKSDDDNGGDTQGDVGSFTANIAGTNFSGDVVALATETNAGPNTILRLQASDANGKALLILLNAFDGPGTYEISSDNTIANTASYTETNVDNPQASPTWAAPYADSGKVGEVTISEKTDTTVKGSFNFTGKEQNGTTFKEITNGQFNVEIQ